MPLQYVHGMSAFRYSALFRVVRWFNLTFPGECSWCFRQLSAVCACLCNVFFVHSFLPVSKGIRNKWLITPVETFSKALLAQSACGRQEHCEPLVAQWTYCRRTCQHRLWTCHVPRRSLLAGKCWFNCVAHIHMMWFPSVSKKKPLKRYLKKHIWYDWDPTWLSPSFPFCFRSNHRRWHGKAWVGRARVDESWTSTMTRSREGRSLPGGWPSGSTKKNR